MFSLQGIQFPQASSGNNEQIAHRLFYFSTDYLRRPICIMLQGKLFDTNLQLMQLNIHVILTLSNHSEWNVWRMYIAGYGLYRT